MDFVSKIKEFVSLIGNTYARVEADKLQGKNRGEILGRIELIQSSLLRYQSMSNDELGQMQPLLDKMNMIIQKIHHTEDEFVSSSDIDNCIEAFHIELSVSAESQVKLSHSQLSKSLEVVKQNQIELFDLHCSQENSLNDIVKGLDKIAARLQSQITMTNVVESLFEIEPPPTHHFDDSSVLGRGTFGTTHRMRNTLDNGLYAVKVIRVKDAEECDVSMEDMGNEAGVLQRLNHAHIVRYFTSYFSNENKLFNLVMELVTGGTISKKIKDESVSLDMIVRWWNQLASALCYMHNDMKIQHRDIKPENILLTADCCNIKIIDLGLACIVKSQAAKEKVGTLLYMSYEKATDLPYDGRDDVWAAGCVMAELMTKSRLKDRGGAIHMYHNAAVNDRRLKLISDCMAVDARYGGIVSQMLQPEQVNRCSSSELMEWLSNSESDVAAAMLPDNTEFLHSRLTESKSDEIRDDHANWFRWITFALSLFLTLIVSRSLLSQNSLMISNLQHFVGLDGWIDFRRVNTEPFMFSEDVNDNECTESLLLLTIASDDGDSRAQGQLGRCYSKGIGVYANNTAAVYYFNLSAAQGNPIGLNGMGYHYFMGYGIGQNFSLALKNYKQSADQGNAEGVYNLGLISENGKGVKPNKSEAFRLYNLSAAQANVDALYRVGLCHEKGIGVPVNYTEALKYFNLAAENGHVEARYTVGRYHLTGKQGVSINYTEAVRYLELVTDRYVGALFDLAYCYKHGFGVDKNATVAFQYSKMAADRGYNEAQYDVGLRYEIGDGTIVDMSAAKKYYRLAADQSHSKAIIRLKELDQRKLRGSK